MAVSSLARKLKIKPGSRIAIINPPPGYLAELESLPEDVELEMKLQGQIDFIQLFVQDKAELARYLPDLLKVINEDGMLWISFPKGSSKIQTDLSRDHGWGPLHKAGYKGVALVSINDTWSAMRFRGGQLSTDQDLVAAQYAGKKASLRPIYEHLLRAVKNFGPDVEIAPRVTYVGLVRGKMFAVIKASTAARIDLGLKLKEAAGDERLVDAPGVGSGSITHKVALANIEQIDDQVLQWLQEAYDGAG